MSNAQQMYSNESLPSRHFQGSHHLAIFNALTLLEGRQCCYFYLSPGEWKRREIKYLPQGDPKYVFRNRRISRLGIARGPSFPPACEQQVHLGEKFAPQVFPPACNCGLQIPGLGHTTKQPVASTSIFPRLLFSAHPQTSAEGTRNFFWGITRRGVRVTRLGWHVCNSFNDHSRRCKWWSLPAVMTVLRPCCGRERDTGGLA